MRDPDETKRAVRAQKRQLGVAAAVAWLIIDAR